MTPEQRDKILLAMDAAENDDPMRVIELLSQAIEQAQKQGCTRSHPHEEMNKECELRTEIARLTNCLSRANALAERFERESYLLGDELEKLQAQKQEPVAWIEHHKAGDNLVWDEPHKGTPLYTSPPQRQPLTDWISVDERLPDVGGYYLVTVATDDGPHVDVLLFDEKRKHWEHEGEPTFCHSYYFEPTHWAHRPEAAHGIKEQT